MDSTPQNSFPIPPYHTRQVLPLLIRFEDYLILIPLTQQFIRFLGFCPSVLIFVSVLVLFVIQYPFGEVLVVNLDNEIIFQGQYYKHQFQPITIFPSVWLIS